MHVLWGLHTVKFNMVFGPFCFVCTGIFDCRQFIRLSLKVCLQIFDVYSLHTDKMHAINSLMSTLKVKSQLHNLCIGFDALAQSLFISLHLFIFIRNFK